MNGTTKKGHYYYGCTGFHENCDNYQCSDNWEYKLFEMPESEMEAWRILGDDY